MLRYRPGMAIPRSGRAGGWLFPSASGAQGKIWFNRQLPLWFSIFPGRSRRTLAQSEPSTPSKAPRRAHYCPPPMKFTGAPPHRPSAMKAHRVLMPGVAGSYPPRGPATAQVVGPTESFPPCRKAYRDTQSPPIGPWTVRTWFAVILRNPRRVKPPHCPGNNTAGQPLSTTGAIGPAAGRQGAPMPCLADAVREPRIPIRHRARNPYRHRGQWPPDQAILGRIASSDGHRRFGRRGPFRRLGGSPLGAGLAGMPVP